jgi:hypothetical protein
MFKIEKGIPTPGNPGAPITGLTQTLRDMLVGDSFLFPKSSRGSFYACARAVPGSKFVTRSASATELRVWRVK